MSNLKWQRWSWNLNNWIISFRVDVVAIRDPDVRCKILFLNALYGFEIVKDIADEILEIREDPIL